MRDNIIVYGATRERAYDKLQQTLDDMSYGSVKDVRKSSHEFIVILKNGDIYKAMCASDSVRGYKWQYAYIDSAIDKQLVDNIVLPNFTPRHVNGEYDANAKIEDRIIWY